MTPLLAQCGRKYAGQTGQTSTIVSGKYDKAVGMNINDILNSMWVFSKFIWTKV